MTIVELVIMGLVIYLAWKLIWGVLLYRELTAETLNAVEVKRIKPMFFEILFNYSRHLNSIYDLYEMKAENVPEKFASGFSKEQYAAALIYGTVIYRQVKTFEEEEGNK